MQGPRSHVDDANSSLAKAQASGATVAEEVAGATVQPEGTELRSEAHRRHAHKLTGRAGGTSSGWVPGAVASWQGLASSRASLSGDPHSVGSKGGLFQAKVGPVDGQSLSGLPGGIQAESGRQNTSHRSWSCLGSVRPPTFCRPAAPGPCPQDVAGARLCYPFHLPCREAATEVLMSPSGHPGPRSPWEGALCCCHSQ